MATDDRPIVWLIDENEYELQTHQIVISRMLKGQVEVRQLQPTANLGDYMGLIQNSLTACVIIDQRLKEAGIAKYNGIDLALFLRGINPKLPIFILTNFADAEDEFAGGEWSVEDIIAKDSLTHADRRGVMAARILRRINVYGDILGQRETRFRELLKKSLESDLDTEEQAQLDELLFQRSAGILTEELKQIGRLQEVIEAHQALMKAIPQSAGEAEYDG